MNLTIQMRSLPSLRCGGLLKNRYKDLEGNNNSELIIASECLLKNLQTIVDLFLHAILKIE